MSLHPIVFLTPSLAAALELPRRLASSGRALAGIYPFKVLDLARALAEPVLLGRGLRAWDSGHDALLAARLLSGPEGAGFGLAADLPRGPVAATLARTFQALRRARVPPGALAGFARESTHAPGDAERLRTLARVYQAFHESAQRATDPATLLAAAAAGLERAAWLAEAEVLVVEDLELDPVERDFLAALARFRPVKILQRELPPGLRPSSFRAWAGEHGIPEAEPGETPLGPLAPPPAPEGLARLRRGLFEPPAGSPVDDGSVALVSAPGEAAEVRAIVRRLMDEASRGVPFEEMGVVLPRPQAYAALFTDLLHRLGVPHRLHPSLPLRFGRSARSLLLLLRCRGLGRSAVMEFLTFAPLRFSDLPGEGGDAQPPRWDAISRDARVVSGYARWMIGLRAYAEAEREAGDKAGEERRARHRGNVRDAEALLNVVEALSATLEALSGTEPWTVWSERLGSVCEQWLGPEPDTEKVLEVIADLGGLGSVTAEAPWEEVEQVLEARFEWERLPLTPLEGGAIHVGALDAIAGLGFRVLAIPGLVEGGYPGVLRPDPFLLDDERTALEKRLGSSPPSRSRAARPAGRGPLVPGRPVR